MGVDIALRPPDQPSRDAFEDMDRFTKHINQPVIFDVGANIGQTVEKIKTHFPRGRVHSFEPSPSTFAILQKNCGQFQDVSLWNYGVGASNGILPFYENTQSDMSSFLKITEMGWGQARQTTNVEVVTIDEFCVKNDVDEIHILKSDTQGFDFEVVKGASGMMAQNKIKLIYLEVIFSAMYRDLPGFDQVFRFLVERNFSLVTFYGFHYQRFKASWTDALFINNEFLGFWEASRAGLKISAAPQDAKILVPTGKSPLKPGK